ncbi:endothelial lipase-like isoform X2 [Denticeps clupeoides]|uniref:endothelial lipase-like isoform X2 n=2 Tax=Denticeps clupeoides TaxID=299321 RepID=UPI0010A2EE4D|nr:endothelial lipase-like isoform X2 [Denticeps clupeoides]XP_028824609.1 endothelial lipase-like isoform X2 [Denticeps clupeoides]
MSRVLGFLLMCFLTPAVSAFQSASEEENALLGESDGDELLYDVVKFNFRKSLDLDEEGCFLQPGQAESLEECGFNASAKTILIIHGWSMSGMFEKWMHKLVAAVRRRETEANVLVVDWLNLSQQLYPTAVNHTRLVGHRIASLLNWLQDEEQLVLGNVHLIGYSLGAHVAGYAGTFVKGRLGRITGLDPAGPMFEGVESHRRLSPDDAAFVDVLHTYTREALGVSIGIQQPIGDIDIYPNGGDVQPGCSLGDMLTTAAAGNLVDVMKCEHERAVHLFVDSLINKDHSSFAYQCSGPDRFKKGICLSCRKNRCNNMGYNAKTMRKRRNSKMYLKTRADTPFGGYHYQMKMHVFNRKKVDDANPSFSVRLIGSQQDSKDLAVDIPDGVGLNFTNTFLVFMEQDVGELLKIELSWEGHTESLSSMWNNVKRTFWSFSSPPKPQVLEVRRIRVKSGETQKKYTFCAEDSSHTEITPGKQLRFVKCRDGWELKPRKRLLV